MMNLSFEENIKKLDCFPPLATLGVAMADSPKNGSLRVYTRSVSFLGF